MITHEGKKVMVNKMGIVSPRLAQIDIIKGLAIIGVLTLHSIPVKLKIMVLSSLS